MYYYLVYYKHNGSVGVPPYYNIHCINKYYIIEMIGGFNTQTTPYYYMSSISVIYLRYPSNI